MADLYLAYIVVLQNIALYACIIVCIVSLCVERLFQGRWFASPTCSHTIPHLYIRTLS